MAITVNTSALLGSTTGFDVQGLVDSMIQAERASEQVWTNQQSTLSSQTSALNDLSSKLTALNTSVDSLNDFFGPFSGRTATSSDTSVVSAAADKTATTAQHVITVTGLATRTSYYTDYVSGVNDGTSEISGGTFTVTMGSNSQTFTIGDSTGTLNDLATEINQLGWGVTASVVTDSKGARLAVVGNDTGKANDFSITTSSDSALKFEKPSTAADASLTVDGIPYSVAGNQTSTVIPGVTLQLTGTSTTPVTLGVSGDTSKTAQAFSDFVSNYNSLISAINAQFAYDSNSGSAGVLAGDSTVRSIQEQLLEMVSGSQASSGNITSLASLGITMNDDGTLSLDSGQLNAALQSNYSDVQNFLQNTTTGFAHGMATVMDSLTNSVDGPIVVELQGISATQQSLTDSINNFETNLSWQRELLVDQLTQANNALQSLPQTLKQISAELGNTSSNS